MSDKEKLQETLNQISKSLKEQVAVNAVTALYDRVELKQLIEERREIAHVHSDNINEKKGFELVKEASEKLNDFDKKHPLISKFISLTK